MKKSREELEKQCAKADTKVEQYQHRGSGTRTASGYYAEGERAFYYFDM